jgi:hypothetical protein
MNIITKTSLIIQYLSGRLAIFILGPLAAAAFRLMGYKVKDLLKLRSECRSLFKKHKGPWLICPNHLTMIDSAILTIAMLPMSRYILQYRLLPWNLPERTNFQSSILTTILCYLSKCIPVNRGGDREEMKSVLAKCDYLLSKKQVLMIFPEGTRSRSGRINTENFSYSVGRFVTKHENCRVMCVYHRGERQDTYGNIPWFGERFTVSVEAFRPCTEYRGLRAQRDYAGQIIRCLARMEEDYFATCRQRHSGPDGSRYNGKKQERSLHQPDSDSNGEGKAAGFGQPGYHAVGSMGGKRNCV